MVYNLIYCMRFKTWLEAMSFDSWDDKRPLNQKKLIVKKDPRYSSFTDEQLERVLQYHTPEELLKLTPQEALERCNDFSFGLGMGLGSDDYDELGL